jgi:hypothetical protein
MVNDSSNIIVDRGVSLTLGRVTGDANLTANGFTISTLNGATLNLAGGTLNAAINNAGTVNAVVSVDGTVLTFGGSIVNTGTFNANAAAGDSTVRFAAEVSNESGEFNANASGSGSRVIFAQNVVNARGAAFNAENTGFANVDNSGEMTLVNSVVNDVVNHASGSVSIAGTTDWNNFANDGRLILTGEQFIITADQHVLTNNGTIPAETESKEEKLPSAQAIFLRMPGMEDPRFRHLQLVLQMFPGNTDVVLYFANTGVRRGTKCQLAENMLAELKNLLGNGNVVIK